MASKAHIRAELHDWGITDKKENPEELLLRLMTQSHNRAQLYARLLQAAAGGLRSSRVAGPARSRVRRPGR